MKSHAGMLTRPQPHEAEAEAEAKTHEAEAEAEATTHEAEAEAEATTHEAEAEAEAEAITHDNAKKMIILGWFNTPQSTPSLLRNKNRSVSFTVAARYDVFGNRKT